MKTQLALVMVALALQAPVARAADPPQQEQIKLLQQQVLALQQQLTTLSSVLRIGTDGSLSLTVGQNRSDFTGGSQRTDVAVARVLRVAGPDSETIGGGRTIQVGGNQSETIDKDLVTRVGGNASQVVTRALSLQVGDRMQLLADDEIVLKTGSASITLRKNGEITIVGTTINVRGSADVVIKGSKVATN